MGPGLWVRKDGASSLTSLRCSYPQTRHPWNEMIRGRQERGRGGGEGYDRRGGGLMDLALARVRRSVCDTCNDYSNNTITSSEHNLFSQGNELLLSLSGFARG